MNKTVFLTELRKRLSGLPQGDIEERLAFYSEMIDDRAEDGLSEEEAVAAIGTVDEIVAQITAETPLSKLVREKVRPKRTLKAWEIVLLVLGAPLWIPLLIAAFAVILSVFIVFWSVAAAFFAVDLALGAAALGCLFAAAVLFGSGSPAAAGCAVGAALVCAALTILMFLVSLLVARGVAKLSGMTLTGIKSLFIGKEVSE